MLNKFRSLDILNIDRVRPPSGTLTDYSEEIIFNEKKYP